MAEAPPEDDAEGAPEWIVTFSDLVSLLVTLFIMLLAFSTQETHDLKKVMNMVSGSFGLHLNKIAEAPELELLEKLRPNVPGGVRELDKTQDPKLETRVAEIDAFHVTGSELDRGLRIVPKTLTGFAPGDDRPSPELAEQLRSLARELRSHRKRIFILEGHCDTASDEGAAGDVTMDILALRRAQRVARIFGLEGVQLEQVRCVSRSDRNPRRDGTTSDAQAENRRVEIIAQRRGVK